MCLPAWGVFWGCGVRVRAVGRQTSGFGFRVRFTDLGAGLGSSRVSDLSSSKERVLKASFMAPPTTKPNRIIPHVSSGAFETQRSEARAADAGSLGVGRPTWEKAKKL